MNDTTNFYEKAAKSSCKVSEKILEGLNSTSWTRDQIIKVVGMMGAVGIFIFGVWQYNDAVEKQFRKPVWEQQIKVFGKLIDATVTVARSIDKKPTKAMNELRSMYGLLIYVADNEVVKAVIEFDDRYEKCISGRIGNGSCTPVNMAFEAGKVATATRAALGRTWDRNLTDFSGDDFLGNNWEGLRLIDVMRRTSSKE